MQVYVVDIVKLNLHNLFIKVQNKRNCGLLVIYGPDKLTCSNNFLSSDMIFFFFNKIMKKNIMQLLPYI